MKKFQSGHDNFKENLEVDDGLQKEKIEVEEKTENFLKYSSNLQIESQMNEG